MENRDWYVYRYREVELMPQQGEVNQRLNRLARHFPQGKGISLAAVLEGFRRLRTALVQEGENR